MEKNSEALKFHEKLGYGLGDAASNFFFVTFNVFLLYYYTDVFGITAAAVGGMFLITKIFDAVSDPIMGLIADRTNSRWGKFRPYLLRVFYLLPDDVGLHGDQRAVFSTDGRDIAGIDGTNQGRQLPILLCDFRRLAGRYLCRTVQTHSGRRR